MIDEDTKQKKAFVLLCKESEQQKLQDLLKEGGPLHPFGLNPVICQVSKYQPLSNQDYAEWGQLWPISFHKYIFSTPDPQECSSSDLLQMNKSMQTAIEQARQAKILGLEPIGAIIVNPNTLEVVAKSFGQKHPLHHSVMCCINQVAEIEMKANELVRKKNKEDEVQYLKQYLCTGYDCYTTQEPCVMCSMALLHSRIRRVIYGSSYPEFGGLGSKYKVHVENGLNHHFQVYKGLLKSECDSLLDEQNSFAL